MRVRLFSQYAEKLIQRFPDLQLNIGETMLKINRQWSSLESRFIVYLDEDFDRILQGNFSSSHDGLLRSLVMSHAQHRKGSSPLAYFNRFTWWITSLRKMAHSNRGTIMEIRIRSRWRHFNRRFSIQTSSAYGKTHLIGVKTPLSSRRIGQCEVKV